MKKLLLIMVLAGVVLTIGPSAPVQAGYVFHDGFETTWSGDYAPGWQNAPYALEEDNGNSVAKMQQISGTVHSGSYATKVIADSVPASWFYWASVESTQIPLANMAKH